MMYTWIYNLVYKLKTSLPQAVLCWSTGTYKGKSTTSHLYPLQWTLNLVISHSCSLPTIWNVLDKMKATCLFFFNEMEFWLKLFQRMWLKWAEGNPWLTSKTRWAERHSAYQHFYQAYKFIGMALEAIALGLHKEDLNSNFLDASWDTDSKTNANSLLHGVTTYEFIVVFLIINTSLTWLALLLSCKALPWTCYMLISR